MWNIKREPLAGYFQPETIQTYLTKEHYVRALPDSSLRLVTQFRQRKSVEPVLEYEYDYTENHSHAQQHEDARHSSHSC